MAEWKIMAERHKSTYSTSGGGGGGRVIRFDRRMYLCGCRQSGDGRGRGRRYGCGGGFKQGYGPTGGDLGRIMHLAYNCLYHASVRLL